MNQQSKQLYTFLSACGGNWRHAIYITCPEDSSGCLLTADRDGKPIIMEIQQFWQFTGEQIDPAECCGQLTEDAFRNLYAQYLLWKIPSAQANPLSSLAGNSL